MFLLEVLCTILFTLFCVAYFTLTERKIIAYIQRRKGPNIVGLWGLIQPIIDGIKAIIKEQIKPLRNFFYFFLLAPFLSFLISLMLLNLLSFLYTKGYFDEYLNMVFFLAISSFNVFTLLWAGWSSNSKYALLGGIRGTAQLFSFEMCFITLLLPIFLSNSTFNIINISILQKDISNIYLFLPSCIYFFVVILAETNRVPFDIPEAEAELVAGYNVEYSAINFAMFFLAEYTNMLINSYLVILIFFGGFNSMELENWFFTCFFFNFKIVLICCLFIIVRAIVPRYRFDQLMNNCWKIILPVSFSFFLFFTSIIYLRNGLLYNLEVDLLGNPYYHLYVFYKT